MMILRLAMVQMNAVVGDLEGNTRAICRWMREAKKAKADVVRRVLELRDRSLPATWVEARDGTVFWVLDSEASSALSEC